VNRAQKIARTLLISWSIVLVIGLPLRAVAANDDNQTRPNILLLLADDLGYGDLACYGHPTIQTPHLDRLADEGTLFRQFYVNGSVCSPSRAALMTGHYPSRQRIFNHLAWGYHNRDCGMPNWLDPGAIQLPRRLRSTGYRTAHFGKWHLGGGSSGAGTFGVVGDPAAPPVADYGYDVVRITLGNGPTWKLGQHWPQRHEIYQYEDPQWTTHSSRLIVDETIAFLEEHTRTRAAQPFFANVWFKDPHVPLDPTPEQRALYADLPEPQQTYYSVVSNLDAQIGRLLGTLEQLGVAGETLVIFTSDNGPSVSKPNPSGLLAARLTAVAGVTGGLRGHKRSMYDGGIRVPLIVRQPGIVPAGRVDAESVLTAVDLLPTLCHIGDVPPAADYQPDGENIADALQGQAWSRTRPIFWEYRLANLDDDSKASPMLVARQGKWKLLMNPSRNRIELFNLQADAGEDHNLATEHPQVAERLATQLLAWKATLPPETHVRQESVKDTNEQRWAPQRKAVQR